MTICQQSIGRARVIAALAIGAAALAGATITARAHDNPEHPVFATELPNVPGKALTAILVQYAPGQKSPVHHHSGSVFAYVVSGAIRSENSATGAVRVYHAGEAFFEPPGSTHLISENASATEPAALLAVFVADDGAKLTSPGKATGQ